MYRGKVQTNSEKIQRRYTAKRGKINMKRRKKYIGRSREIHRKDREYIKEIQGKFKVNTV